MAGRLAPQEEHIRSGDMAQVGFCLRPVCNALMLVKQLTGVQGRI